MYSEALVCVLNERVQHQHLLTLLDSLADGLLGRSQSFKIKLKGALTIVGI